MRTKHHGDLTAPALVESLRKTTLPFFEKHFGDECTEAEVVVVAAIDFLESLPVSLTEQIANDSNVSPAFRAALASPAPAADDAARDAVDTLRQWARKAAAFNDADHVKGNTIKAHKILMALAGYLPGYSAEIDGALATSPTKEQGNG